MPVRETTAHPMSQVVCAACQGGLVHRLVTLHAGSDTMLVCSGAWEGLPSWLKESFGDVRKNGGVEKRREVVAEIRDEIKATTERFKSQL
jgi:hypothetical protein